MAPIALAGIVLSAVLLTACDYSQKKPETGSLAGAPSAHSGMIGAQAPAGAQRAPAVESGVGERSIRLFGRGVSRQRQIRV